MNEKTTTCEATPNGAQLPGAMTIWEWLIKNVDSHDIYEAEALGADFQKSTGYAPCWPVYSPEEVRAQIKARGLGGFVKVEEGDAAACNGWEIAEALAYKYANWQGTFQMGRGSRFRAAVEALVKAGV